MKATHIKNMKATHIKDMKATHIKDMKATHIKDMKATHIKDMKATHIKNMKATHIKDMKATHIKDMKITHIKDMKTTHIIGRENESEQLWEILELQSVVLASLRRIGKTCLLKKMAQHPHPKWQIILYIVQGKTSVEEFVQGLYASLIDAEIIKAAPGKVRQFYSKWLAGQKLSGYELPSLNKHWKELLNAILEEVAESDKPTLIMLDEFPWMLFQLITKYDAEEECMELLDTMRTIRENLESTSKLRFIFCGSIGFNVVLDWLTKKHRYLGNPTNNMYTYVLKEMSDQDAAALCHHLGEQFHIQNADNCYFHIAESVQNLPFYIDLIFKELRLKKLHSPTRKEVEQVISDLVLDASGNGHFDHYRERLEAYYNEEERRLGYFILQLVASEEETLTRATIREAVKVEFPEYSSESVSEVIKDLMRDLYLQMDEQMRFGFRYQLLRRWWRMYYC